MRLLFQRLPSKISEKRVLIYEDGAGADVGVGTLAPAGRAM
jgi:hypothetical protein